MRSLTVFAFLCLPSFVGLHGLGLPAKPLAALPAEPPPATWQVGVAKVDITPDYPIRLSGFGSRRAESEGVEQKIWVKALVIGAEEPTVLLTVDSIGIPLHLRQTLAARLAQKIGLKPERFAICATHTHTAPMIAGNLFTLFGVPIPADHQARIDRYTAELTDKMEQAVLAAHKDVQPSQLYFALGQARFAANRRTKGGPVDHDLPLMVVKTPAGKIRALFVNYACHCTTLSFNRITGDWAGYAAELIEAHQPGVVALVAIGCGADANPERGVTGDRVDLARGHGGEIADEVKRLLGGFLKPITGPLQAKLEPMMLALDALPSQEEWETRAQRKDAIGYHAQVQLERLARGEKLKTQIDYSVQTWAFGDSLAMVFLPGEVVVDYALRLKKELDPHRLWVNGYANDVPCYIASERILKEGGYEGGGAMTYYDLPARLKPGLEQPIIDAVHRQLGQPFKPPFAPDKVGGSKPSSPQQSLAQIRSHFHVELVAAEPFVGSPVAIDWGPDGRMFVAEMADYPQGTDGRYQPGGRVRLLTASRGDFQYDRATVFLDQIPFPTGVTAYRRGVLVCAAPDILYAEDTDGDGRADVVRKLYTGFGTENYQARVNSIAYGLDHWWHGSCGLYGGAITNEKGQSFRLGHRDFRIRPDEGNLEPATGRTQQGRCRDDWGSWFGCDNSTIGWHYPLPDHYLRRNPHVAAPPAAVPMAPWTAEERLYPIAPNMQLFARSGPSGRPTAACGYEIYRDDLLGDDFRGNAFICEAVNLLVHRRILQPSGSSFKAVRAPEEQDREFLASLDPWFRPVQVRTGPDGALWIVDMYRFVIEHPIWIPPGELAKLDLRAGSTMGRIYRVYPKDKAPRQRVPLEQLDAAGLVAALDSPNGWQRDMASQMLLWRSDASAIPWLAKLASHPRAETRLHALALLQGMGQLTAAQVESALTDSHPGVRRNALRWAEPFLSHDGVRAKVCSLAKDEDPQVRLQAALSLGFSDSPDAAQALGRLLLDHAHDPYLVAAALSSVRPPHLAIVMDLCLASQGTNRPPDALLRKLMSLAVGWEDRRALAAMVQALLPHGEEKPQQWQWDLLGSLLDHLQRKGQTVEKIFDAQLMAAWQRTLGQVRQMVLADTAAEEDRKAALRLMGRVRSQERLEVDLLGQVLTPQSSDQVQTEALLALGRMEDAAAAALIASRWKQLSPALKNQALDLLLSRPAWQKQLLASLDQQEIIPGMIDAARRQRLLNLSDAALRSQAERHFMNDTPRADLLREYQEALALKGDAARGQLLFQKQCANCHKWQETGHAVGPDLASIGNRTPAYLLAEILDPNRTIDNRFVEYLALTKAGLLHSGVLVSESSTSITLRGQESKEHVLLRRDIEELRATGKSLMPEGMEKDLTKQDMADLLALLTGPAGTSAAVDDPKTVAMQLLDDKVPGEQKTALLNKHLGQAAAIVAALAADLKDDPKEEYRRIPWIWRVSITAARKNETDVLHQLLLAALPHMQEPLRDWQAVVIGGGIINGISLNGQWPHLRIQELFHTSPPALARYHRALELSYAMAEDEKVPAGTRYDALRMIAVDRWTKSRPVLIKYLAKGVHDELQMGAISGLSDVDEPEAAALLLSGMGHYSAGNRKLALEALLRTEGRVDGLLEALDKGTVKKEWLDEGLKKRLHDWPNPKQRDRARDLLKD